MSFHLGTALMACKMFKELARKAEVLREIELHHDLKKNAEYCHFPKDEINLYILAIFSNNANLCKMIAISTTL